MKLFFGGFTEPRVEDVLGLHHEARRTAPAAEPGSKEEPDDEASLAPTLEIVLPTWDEWNLTLLSAELR